MNSLSGGGRRREGPKGWLLNWERRGCQERKRVEVVAKNGEIVELMKNRYFYFKKKTNS